MQTVPIVSIVDDDVAVGQATRDILRSNGYLAALFDSAEAFLSSGRISETRCLITDVRMPGMSGFELRKRLIAEGHNIPTIFITALPEETVREDVRAAGAQALLTKPFREQYLISCVAAALQMA